MSADDGLRTLLRKHLSLPDWRWTPLETGLVVAGVPDAYWAHAPSRTSGWVECKATTGWAIRFQPHQVGWLRDHSSRGVRCAVAVRTRGRGSSSGRGDGLVLVAGAAAWLLEREGLRPLLTVSKPLGAAGTIPPSPGAGRERSAVLASPEVYNGALLAPPRALLGRWLGPPEAWDWEAIAVVLTAQSP